MKNNHILLEKYLRAKVRKMLSEEEANPQQVAQAPAIFNALGSVIGSTANSINAALASDSIIKQELETPDTQPVANAQEQPIEEGLGLLVGGILSLGKLSELVGAGLGKIGKKVGADEKSAIMNISNWLHTKGHAYTHGIENIINKTLENTPMLKNVWNKASDSRKDFIVKGLLTTVIAGLAIGSGIGTIKALASGENILGTIEGVLTGTKGAEISANFPKIVAGFMEHVLGQAPQV